MTKIQFYTNPMSRGQIARWALHEAGVDYEQVLLDYATTMKGAEYLAINPMGKVPAIEHDGKIVTESAAICAYLAAAFLEADLAPREEELADYFRWMFFAAGPVESAITMHALKWEPSDEQQRTLGFGSYQKVVDVLDEALRSRQFVCGDRFTMADVYVGSHVDWGLSFGTLPKRDAFEAYAGRLREREAYQASKAIDNDLIAQARS